jgi:DNA-binding transcriptional LysR family regulator
VADVHRPAIDLNLLIVFDAVMRERNLTRAGRRLGLSQPATSQALARLRHMLRDDLFVRAPDRMQPTPRAEQMAEVVREALHALTLILEPEEFDPPVSTRGFTLSVNTHAARAIVPALARVVAELAPQVSLDVRPLDFADALDQLDRGEADVALSRLVDGGERFKCVRIMDDDYAVVLDKQHPAAQRATISIGSLATIPHIVTSGDEVGFIDAALAEQGLERRIALRMPFVSLGLMLVGADRVAVLPRRVAHDLARICPVVVRDLPIPSPRITLSMIWHRRLDNQPAQRWLRERIRRAA